MPYALDRLLEVEEERKKQSSALKDVQDEKDGLGPPPYLVPGSEQKAEELSTEESRLEKEIERLEKESRDLLPAAEKELFQIGRLGALQHDLDTETRALELAEKGVEEEKKQLGDRPPNSSDKDTAGARDLEVYRIKNNIQVIEKEMVDIAQRLDPRPGRGIEDQRANELGDKELSDVMAEQPTKKEEKAIDLAGDAADPATLLKDYRELKEVVEKPGYDEYRADQPEVVAPGDATMSLAILAGFAISATPSIKEAYQHYAPKVAEYITDKVLEGPRGGRPTGPEGVLRGDPPITEREAAPPRQDRGEVTPAHTAGAERKTPMEATKVVDGREQARYEEQKEALAQKRDEKREALDKTLEQIQLKFDERNANTDPDKKKELQAKLDERFKLEYEKLEKEQERELARVKEPPDLRFH